MSDKPLGGYGPAILIVIFLGAAGLFALYRYDDDFDPGGQKHDKIIREITNA